MRGIGAWLALAAMWLACSDTHGVVERSRTQAGAGAGGKPAASGGHGGRSGSAGEVPCSGFGCAIPPSRPEPLCKNGPWPEDGDGVPFMLEREAGLDPCDEDSDDDGCPDSAEYYAGGCAGVLLLQEPCFGAPATSDVKVALPAGRGPWRDVSLRASGFDGPVTVDIDLIGDDDAGTATGDSFGPAAPGETVAFHVRASVDSGNVVVRGVITIVGDGEVLSELRVIIVPALNCAIPI